MDDFEVQEIDLGDLLGAMKENVKKDIKDFGDLVDLDAALDRNIFITAVDDETGMSVNGLIRYWNRQDDLAGIPAEKRQPIRLYIDSWGGSLSDALTVIDSVKISKTPVWGICIGAAYSAGFFILISCDKRIAYRHSSFLFHEGSAGNSGTAAQFANFAAFYKKQLNQLRDLVLENTKITAEEYQDIKKDDVWYDAEEALEKGIVDEIAEELV